MKNINILFSNAQNDVYISRYLKYIIHFCCRLTLKLENFKNPVELSISFVTGNKIKELNARYKNKDFVTDVLSFSTKSSLDFFRYDQNICVLGDIVICAKKALDQMLTYGSGCFEEEISRLVVHGLLHILGYDHLNGKFKARVMKNKEDIISNIISRKFYFERVKYI